MAPEIDTRSERLQRALEKRIGLLRSNNGLTLRMSSMKAHKTFARIAADILGGGNLFNHDAQPGERHYIQTRRGFNRGKKSTKNAALEAKVAEHCAIREPGALEMMHPGPNHRSGDILFEKGSVELKLAHAQRRALPIGAKLTLGACPLSRLDDLLPDSFRNSSLWMVT